MAFPYLQYTIQDVYKEYNLLIIECENLATNILSLSSEWASVCECVCVSVCVCVCAHMSVVITW